MLDEVNVMKPTPATQATADELQQMLKGNRVEMLKTGATVPLIGEGRVEVKALDDADALKRARPDKEGAIDAPDNAEREEAIAKRLAGVRGLAVAILGGKHDLSAGAEEMGTGREVPARRDGGVPGRGDGVIERGEVPHLGFIVLGFQRAEPTRRVNRAKDNRPAAGAEPLAGEHDPRRQHRPGAARRCRRGAAQVEGDVDGDAGDLRRA